MVTKGTNQTNRTNLINSIYPVNPSPKPRRRSRRNLLTAAAFLLPNFLGFAVFTALPVAFSLGISFTNWNLQQTIPFQWIGLGNFLELARDQQFWSYFLNTVYFLLGLPPAIAGSLFLAVLLDQKLRGVVVYRTLFYLPGITSGIALMILWKALFNQDFGPINRSIEWCISILQINDILQAIGLSSIAPPPWLFSTYNLLGIDVEGAAFTTRQWGLGARDAIIIMGIWTAVGGANMLLYMAALSNIPQHLYDAAAIDGASLWPVFRYITWPLLAPTTFFITVISFIGGLQGGFEQAKVMTNGGPAGTTTTLAFYIYTKAFEEYQLGYASAIAWLLFLVIFAITMVHWRYGNRDLND